jgi:hypothetical protein
MRLQAGYQIGDKARQLRGKAMREGAKLECSGPSCLKLVG